MKPFRDLSKEDSKSENTHDMSLGERNLFKDTAEAGNLLTNQTSPDPYFFVYGQPRGLFPTDTVLKQSGAFKPTAMYKEPDFSQFIPQRQVVYVQNLPSYGYIEQTPPLPAKPLRKQRGIFEEAVENDTKELIYRSDVIQKGWFRNAYAGIVIPHTKKACSGAKKAEKFFNKLIEMLKEDVTEFSERSIEFQAKLIGPLAKNILKKDFMSKTKEWTRFKEEMKELIIREGNSFKDTMKNYSYVPERELAFAHPIFSLAKSLIEKNEIYQKRFWKRFNDRRGSVGSLETFQRRVNQEMANILNIDDPSTFSHFQ